jgi:hypothetical protein
VSVEALLHLLELKQEYQLAHQTALALLLPAPVRIDPLINLIADVVAQEKEEAGIIVEQSASDSQLTDTHPAKKTESADEVIVGLASIDDDFTGRGAVAFSLQGMRYQVGTWKEVAVRTFSELHRASPRRFREAALTVVGRKRPYFTLDKTDLRHAEPIPDADLYFEANLSANSLVKLCYTVVERLGLSRSVFDVEAEP